MRHSIAVSKTAQMSCARLRLTMNPFLARLFFVLVICTSFALTASAQITEATLKISVTDSLSSPIAGTYADILNEEVTQFGFGTFLFRTFLLAHIL